MGVRRPDVLPASRIRASLDAGYSLDRTAWLTGCVTEMHSHRVADVQSKPFVQQGNDSLKLNILTRL